MACATPMQAGCLDSGFGGGSFCGGSFGRGRASRCSLGRCGPGGNMSSGGALVTEPRHTLLSARAFSYVSAGFGLGGGGAGAARKHRAGQNKSGDEKDEETKPKCHESHCHLGYLGFYFYFSIRFSVARLSDLSCLI